ncbi:MAG TPA: TRAP transporter substrate-binding protein DctP [Polyangia bacterium]|nr:TRAP transporter substrate-binding protein DctP [Polyangia bacterium]
MRPLLAFTLVVATLGTARADPVVLRMATVAPDGTAWARELRAGAREVEDRTNGRLRIKWYFGAIGGDELTVQRRIRQGQLDGTASGGMLCTRAAPALRILRIPGIVQDRHQAAYVLSHLRPIADDEFRKSGLVNLGYSMLGASVLFTREPIRTFEDLKRARLWRWDLDDVAIELLRGAGLNIVALPLEAAGTAFDKQEIDGFSALPAAALAFQWSAQARYFTELPMDYLVGCMVVATRAFDELPNEDRQVLQTATAKMMLRAQDLDERMSEALFGSLFEKQGMHRVAPSKLLWAQFFETARDARQRLAAGLVDHELLARVLGWLGDYQPPR